MFHFDHLHLKTPDFSFTHCTPKFPQLMISRMDLIGNNHNVLSGTSNEDRYFIDYLGLLSIETHVSIILQWIAMVWNGLEGFRSSGKCPISLYQYRMAGPDAVPFCSLI